MRFRNSASVLVLTASLFLVPLYSVYAQDGSRSANLRINPLQNRQNELSNLQTNFDQKIALMKDKIASREAQFNARLALFKDQTKAQLAEEINHNLNLINQNQTMLMNKNLQLMSTILDQVVNQVGGTASNSAQVTAARSAIANAQTAVTNQAGKDYTINVSTESAIHKDAQTQRDLLHSDLTATRQLVLAARQATITAVHSLLHPNPSPIASGSATVNVKQSFSASKESTATGLPVSQ